MGEPARRLLLTTEDAAELVDWEALEAAMLAAQKQRPPISERPRGSPHATRDVR